MQRALPVWHAGAVPVFGAEGGIVLGDQHVTAVEPKQVEPVLAIRCTAVGLTDDIARLVKAQHPASHPLPVDGDCALDVTLLGALFAACGVPQALDDVSTPLLRHLMLLLIPSVAAVGLYAGLLSQHAAAFLLVAVVVTALTLVVTAWTLQRLIRRSSR